MDCIIAYVKSLSSSQAGFFFKIIKMKQKLYFNPLHVVSKYFIVAVMVLVAGIPGAYSQVAINLDGSLPDSSAMLDVSANGLGLLVPRMKFSERPVDPSNGLLIYQTNQEKGFYFYDSINWKKIGQAENDYWKQNEGNIYFNLGDLGIGTDEPEATLHLAGNIEILRVESVSSDPLISFYSGTNYKAWMQAFGDDFYITNRMAGRLRLRTANVDRLVIDASGNVVIGATSGASGYRLSVNGKMACEEILIDDQGYWPDYVFSDKYSLLPIEQLHDSIAQNHHLPGIPSAEKIKAQGGHHVGDTQKQMLEKIEELSLYIIQLNERIKELESVNTAKKTERQNQ